MADDNPAELLLCETFTHFESNKKIKINFFKDCLKFYTRLASNRNDANQDRFATKPDKTIYLNDLAGSSIGKSFKLNDKTAYLTLYAYPKQLTNDTSKRAKRKRLSLVFGFNSYDSLKKNLHLINEWHIKLDFLLKKDPLEFLNGIYDQTESLDRNVNINTNINEIDFKAKKSNDLIRINSQLVKNANRKPYLVLINPTSGAGKARNIFYECVKPVWSEANVSYVIIETKYSKHATDIMKSMNIDEFRGVIVVSGDGLLYEVINGILERPDWKLAIKTPVSQLPGGSANAFACTAAYLSNESFADASLEQFAKTMAFYLSKAESVPLDLMKFQLCDGSLVHAFLALEYAFIADVDLESEAYRFLGNFRFTLGAIIRIANLRTYHAKISFLPVDEDYKPKDSSYVIKRNSSGSQVDTENGFEYLAKLDEPVPDNWCILEDEFILFLCSNLPMIGPDFLSAPEASFNDGYMHLIFLKKGVSKVNITKLLLDTSTDEYYNLPFLEHVKIKAFRLEPLKKNSTENSDDGVLMIDGERVKFGNIQGEIKPSIANTLGWDLR